ncbi:hypothetical protein M513_12794 [Trichuris suis]|uniref:DDE-1 domain-containing protein n=1 Tax=Trichuris suis TaxID=68888 RepID=A0A085LMX0_9BILA|nr:hypothetical protein M513_12794 [Trichuris suis]
MVQLPVIYHANKNGWTTTEITSEWCEDDFVAGARAHCSSIGLDHECKIVLILDNCPAHPNAELTKNNVCTVGLRPNCTSLIQPLDNSTMHSLKSKYRTMLMTHLLSAHNSRRPVQEFLKTFNLRSMDSTSLRMLGNRRGCDSEKRMAQIVAMYND